MPMIGQMPSDYVRWLTQPGLPAPPDATQPFAGEVALAAYVCAEPKHGGNTNALLVAGIVQKVAADEHANGWIHDMPRGEFARIFTGQGHPSRVQQVWQFIHQYRDSLAAYKGGHRVPPLAKYFERATTAQALQRMVQDKCFGLDCIGFVGRYLESERLFTQYPGYYPRDYLDKFFPIRSLAELDRLCVLVWANGTHIAIVDSVDSLGSTLATVTICQSSSGGPQINERVGLRAGDASDYIKFDEYRRALGGRDLPEAEKEALRKKFTVKGATTGYRGGIFLRVEGAVPVPGHVYAGKLPQPLTFLKDWAPRAN